MGWQRLSGRLEREPDSALSTHLCRGGCMGCLVYRSTLSKSMAPRKGHPLFDRGIRKTLRSESCGCFFAIAPRRQDIILQMQVVSDAGWQNGARCEPD